MQDQQLHAMLEQEASAQLQREAKHWKEKCDRMSFQDLGAFVLQRGKYKKNTCQQVVLKGDLSYVKWIFAHVHRFPHFTPLVEYYRRLHMRVPAAGPHGSQQVIGTPAPAAWSLTRGAPGREQEVRLEEQAQRREIMSSQSTVVVAPEVERWHSPRSEDGWSLVSSSAISVASSDSSGPCCFLKDAIFKTPSGPCQAGQLKQGSEVLAADGKTWLKVKSVLPQEVDQTILLKAGSAFLEITPNHRITVSKDGKSVPRLR